MMGRVELSNHEEVRCASTWQGLWSFCRPQTFEGVTEYNDRFWEISMNLKGAVSGCMGNGGEGRLGKKLVELMCALDRKNRKARVMVDVDPRRLGARNEYNNKFAIGTNITTDELIEAIWELGQVEEYGGLKHFKVDEVKGGDLGTPGTQRKLWMLSESGKRQTIWAEATWMMQAGVYVHGYGAAAFGAGGEGVALIRYALAGQRTRTGKRCETDPRNARDGASASTVPNGDGARGGKEGRGNDENGRKRQNGLQDWRDREEVLISER